MSSTSSQRTCTVQDEYTSILPFRRGGASLALPPEGAGAGAAALHSTDESIDGEPLTLQEMIEAGIDPDDLAEPSEDSDEEYYQEVDLLQGAHQCSQGHAVRGYAGTSTN